MRCGYLKEGTRINDLKSAVRQKKKNLFQYEHMCYGSKMVKTEKSNTKTEYSNIKNDITVKESK